MFRVDDVTAGYGESTVLRGVSLEVPDGAVAALLGPNGAGKTTLMRVAAGLIRPRTGHLSLGGADITRHSPHERVKRGLCHIPEGRGVFPSLTVRENLSLQSAPGQQDESIERAVSAFPRLGERLPQLAGTMSGGEQQMLALARAYIQNPRVVLLDEVSLGLAPKVVDEIFEFLAKLRDGGAALVLVEQYVNRALALADQVYLLNRGEIVFSGSPDQVDEATLFEQYVGVG
ncbi:ABC transporter ATP-binding protein [Sporichthya polymorpha]|uniref:ABC transporter ATP-binding protein n=1 Tax=Sporichthya polymorpha TaxID=35751 RepID=UPI000371E0BA|nr:ABC transporter ATP-binding protein [Sporichthya polymorpha]